MKKIKILVLGCNSFLGYNFTKKIIKNNNFVLLGTINKNSTRIKNDKKTRNFKNFIKYNPILHKKKLIKILNDFKPNVIINFKSHDIAFSKSYVLAWHQRFNNKTAIIYGQYHDEFLRDKDRWMITKRKMFMNGSDDNFKVKIFPFKRKIPPKNWVPPKIDES